MKNNCLKMEPRISLQASNFLSKESCTHSLTVDLLSKRCGKIFEMHHLHDTAGAAHSSVSSLNTTALQSRLDLVAMQRGARSLLYTFLSTEGSKPSNIALSLLFRLFHVTLSVVVTNVSTNRER